MKLEKNIVAKLKGYRIKKGNYNYIVEKSSKKDDGTLEWRSLGLYFRDPAIALKHILIEKVDEIPMSEVKTVDEFVKWEKQTIEKAIADMLETIEK